MIRTKINMDDPTPIGKFLGCGHTVEHMSTNDLERQLAAAIPLTKPEDDKQGKVNSQDDEPKTLRVSGDRHGGDKVNVVRYEMTGFMDQCVERYLELAEKGQETLKHAFTPGLDDHTFSEEDWTLEGILAPIAARVIMNILYAARMFRYDMLHTVNALARQITKWCRACDKKLHRLVVYIHHTRLDVTERGGRCPQRP